MKVLHWNVSYFSPWAAEISCLTILFLNTRHVCDIDMSKLVKGMQHGTRKPIFEWSLTFNSAGLNFTSDSGPPPGDLEAHTNSGETYENPNLNITKTLKTAIQKILKEILKSLVEENIFSR
jgi:hypothetical protein